MGTYILKNRRRNLDGALNKVPGTQRVEQQQLSLGRLLKRDVGR